MNREGATAGGRRIVVLAIVGGLASGVIGSLAVNLWLGKREAPRSAAPNARELAEAVENPGADRLKFLAVAAALNAASERHDRAAPAPPAATPPPVDGRALFQGFAEAHQREVEDPAWATKTKTGLTHDLQSLEKLAHFSSFALECGSKTCSGEIEWSSIEQARTNIPIILHNKYGINSGVRYMFPQPSGPGPCRVSVIFEPQDIKVEPVLE